MKLDYYIPHLSPVIHLFWLFFHNHVLGLLVNLIQLHIFAMGIKNTDREATALGWFIDAFKRFSLPEEANETEFLIPEFLPDLSSKEQICLCIRLCFSAKVVS